MKVSKFYFPLFAAAMLASCSNESDPVINGGDNNLSEVGYVAVNIVQAASNTRADQEYSAGSEAENKATTGLFYIFSADGNTQYGSAQELPLTVASSETEGADNNVEKIYNAVLLIDGVEDDPSKDNSVKQIICVLNAPAGLKNETITKLSDLQSKIGDYSAHESGKFIMTNSVYATKGEDNKYSAVYGAPITSDNIKKSSAEAINSAVDIYVERVVAKVTATWSDNFPEEPTITPDGGDAFTVSGEIKNFKIVIKGIEIANIAPESYLIKNIDNLTGNTKYDWAWSKATDHRSFWENTPATWSEGKNYLNLSYNDIKGLNKGNSNKPALDAQFTYIQPNTRQGENKNKLPNTAVLLTAQLMDDDKPADLVYLLGSYYKAADAKDLIAQYLYNKGFRVQTSTTVDGTTTVTYDPITSGIIEWTDELTLVDGDAAYSLKSYEVVAKVNKEGKTIVKIDGENKVVEGVEVNNFLSKSTKYYARVWNDGMCYYFVNIDQSPVAGSDVGAQTYPGVVRNHVYQLELEDIQGVGVPVFNGESVIIPEIPEDDELYFLAAKINVLSWKIVKQGVHFKN